MASTTNRTVELQIKLAGVQSLEQLEQVTTEINDDLKQMPINSKAFTEMSALAKKANSQLKEVDASLEGITSTEKAESVLKMGEGIAGAFQIAGAASLVFGEQTQEQIQKVIVGVGSMVAAIDGARKLTEAFSAKNIAGLKSVVQGFKESAIGAKLFGASARTALLSTGILAFVVALGTVVAYWDEITGFFKENAENKALQESVKYSEAKLENLKQYQDAQNKIISAAEKQFAVDGKSADLTSAKLKSFEIGQQALQEEIRLLESKKKLEEKTLETALKDRISMFNSAEENNKIIEEETNLYHQRIAIIGKNIDATNELYNANKANFFKLKNEEAGAGFLDATNKNIDNLNNKLTVLGSQANKESEIYNVQVKLLKDKLSLITGATQEDQRQEDSLNAQIQALYNKEQLRLKELAKHREQVALEIQELQHQKEINIRLDAAQAAYSDLLAAKEKELTLNQQNGIAIENNLAIVEQEKAIFQEFFQIRQELSNFDKMGNELFIKQNESVMSMLDFYDQAIEDNKEILRSMVGVNEVDEKILARQAIELTLFKESQALQIDKLNNTNAALELSQDSLVIQIEELKNANTINQTQVQYYQNLLDQARVKAGLAKTDDERLEAANVIADLEGKVREYTLGVSENKAQIASLDNQINVTGNEILNNTNQIASASAAITTETNKAAAAVENQSRGYAKAQEFVKQYGKEIQAGQQLINAAFDLQIAQLERKAELEKRNLEDIQAQKEGYAAKDEELQALLADAQGERYDDLLQMIQANDLALQASADAELNSKRIIADAEWKAAKAKKTQSIIDATIQGALAVVEALPNVFLSVLVGALSAVQIGVIASQPLPEKPNFASGGVVKASGYPRTGDKVPVNVNPDEMILNNQQQARLFAIADGSPNINTNSGIDYRLIGIEVGNALAANPMYVSVTEFNQVQNRLKIVENRASLSK